MFQWRSNFTNSQTTMSLWGKLRSSKLRPGDLVEVLPYREILETLDENGQVDNMPFMPEMIKYCGKRFRIYKRANYVCIDENGTGGLNKTVTLENVRCDGAYHSGCQKACFIFWKEEWLRKCSTNTNDANSASNGMSDAYGFKTYDFDTGKFICQSTTLYSATVPIRATSKICYLIKELFSGNRAFVKSLKELPCFIKFKILGKSANSPCRFLKGMSQKTPTFSLNLQAGDWVEVKSLEEIAKTLDGEGKNRGLAFTAEMHNFCGMRARVKHRLDKMISETNGQLVDLADTVLLENVACRGICTSFGCSRHAYHYWREIWLRKI